MKHKKSKIIKVLVTIIILLTLTVIILSLEQNETVQKLFHKKEIIKIELKDECSNIFNNIIHQIKTENNCESLCKNECSSRNMEYEKIEFQLEEASCNSCNCYCK